MYNSAHGFPRNFNKSMISVFERYGRETHRSQNSNSITNMFFLKILIKKYERDSRNNCLHKMYIENVQKQMIVPMF